MANFEDNIKAILEDIEKDVLSMRNNLNSATKMVEDQTKSLNMAVKLLAGSMNISEKELAEMMADVENSSLGVNNEVQNENASSAGPLKEAEENTEVDTLHKVD
ncbi:uncharacterized protein LOC126844390 isoform X1 [Adelges cooleyi]|uniref:uncharacterized protein LOC126844390 isoform X1 n=1 Tax=Adelges cooleyi TaxID=133065 RepID=UPI00217F41EE|nr:uncharacterized protein LOC126844390 isoform X1 [Adelges cooleyi]